MTRDKSLKVLLVEDSDTDARLLQENILLSGIDDLYISVAQSLQQAIDYLKNNHIDATLLDLTLPDSSGLQTVIRLRLASPDTPIVVLTGVDDEKTGVEAVRMGVQDYLVKGQTDGRLIARAVRYAIERKRMGAELRKARDELETRVQERTSELSEVNKALAAEIAERKRSEVRTGVTNFLLELFVQKTTRKEYLDSVAKAIHYWSDCQCIGIRLVNSNGYIPYESHIGFTEEFLATENMLSLKTDVCTCMRIITQTPEPQDAPVMTPKGSFCCGNTGEFFNSLPKKSKTRYRGHCLRAGFTSLAVVPIRYRDKVLGAIHLADEKQDNISPETVKFLENMAMLIGEAVHRFDVETELRESEERYRQLVEVSPDGIRVEINGTIVFINAAGAKLLGYNSPEELIGKSAMDFIHPDYVKRSQRQLRYLQKKQKPLPMREEKFVRLDGKVIDVEVAATPLIYRNRPAEQIVFRDITGRKTAEEKILADQKQLRTLTAELVLTEERERHKIATALHDSIGPILAFSKREIGTLQKQAPKKIAESLKDISLNITQAVEQTRNLTFDLSPPTLYTLGFETAVEELTERFCREQKLECFFENSSESKPISNHIKILLYRSIRELLINVVKHSGAMLVKVSLSRVNNHIQVVVEDDGKGFDLSCLQSGLSMPKGFGLFSVRERLTHIGGKFNILSARGKGTKVTLLAPLQPDRKQRKKEI